MQSKFLNSSFNSPSQLGISMFHLTPNKVSVFLFNTFTLFLRSNIV